MPGPVAADFVKFRNKLTGNIVEFSPDDATRIERARTSGDYELVSGLSLDTADGTAVYDAAAANRLIALGKAAPTDVGETYVAAENEATKQEHLDELLADGTRAGTLKLLGATTGVANTLFAGAPNAIQSTLSRGSDLAEGVQEYQSDANMVGQVLGAIGTLGTGAAASKGVVGATELLGQAAGRKVQNQVLSKALQYGVEGASQTALQSLFDALGNEKSLGEALLSARNGGIFGGVLGAGAGGIFGKLSSRVTPNSSIPAAAFDALPFAGQKATYLNQQAFRALNDLNDLLGPQAGRVISEVADVAPAAGTVVGRKVANVADTVVDSPKFTQAAEIPLSPVATGQRRVIEQVRGIFSNPERLADLSPAAATKHVKALAAVEAAIESELALTNNTAGMAKLKQIREQLQAGFMGALDGSAEAVRANLHDTTLGKLAGIAGAEKYAHSSLAKAYMNAYGSRRLAAGHAAVRAADVIQPTGTPAIDRAAKKGWRTGRAIFNAVRFRGQAIDRVVRFALAPVTGPVKAAASAVLGGAAGTKLAVRLGAPAAFNAATAALRFFEPADVDYRGAKTAYMKRLAELNTVAAQPGRAHERFEQQLGIRNISPQVSGAIAEKHVQAAQFLHSKAPKPPATLRYGQHWEPSATDLHTWNRYVTATTDPWSVLSVPSRATKEHRETLEALYPELLHEYTMGVLANEKKLSKLSYDQTFGLSVLTGVPLDPTLQPENKDVFLSIFKNDTGAGQPAAQPQQSKSAANEYTVGQTIGAK